MQESVEVADGITLTAFQMKGRPAGGARQVQADLVTVGVWVDGRIMRAANYRDIEEARAAAKRLAEEPLSREGFGSGA